MLCPQVKHSKLSYAICDFLGYGDGQTGYCCYDPTNQKLYVSRHVVFHEHLPFYSLSSNPRNPTRSSLTRIDPFSMDISDFNNSKVEKYRVDTSTPTGQDVPMTPSEPPMVVDPPPPHYPPHVHKSTQTPYFLQWLLFCFFCFFPNHHSKFI